MRLLNISTLQLETFYGASVPPYAILSHTWGPEEIVFDHIKTSGYQRGKCEKIDGSCDEALKWGVRHVWIDTCCIDKGSSAELTEAINSMFDWYRKAVICFAYLVDVPSSREVPDQDPKDRMRAFRTARWFRRGWTLQELLAPVQVLFFDAGWQLLGCRGKVRRPLSEREPYRSFNAAAPSLDWMLEDVTGIDMLYLVGAWELGRASVAQRMSWAAGRETTRAEDLAYCLLGIFGISMPLLYGEGEKAFVRLQEEIIKVSNDQTVFASDRRHHDISRAGGGRGAEDLLISSSLLATGPEDFRRSRAMVPFRADGGGRKGHYMMTNNGLFAHLQVMELAHPRADMYLIRLACRWDNIFMPSTPGAKPVGPTTTTRLMSLLPSRPVAILAYKEPDEEGSEEFWRVPHPTVFVSEEGFAGIPARPIYLSRAPREFCRARIDTKMLLLPEYDSGSVLGVYPPFWAGLLEESKVVLFPEGDPTEFGPYTVWVCLASSRPEPMSEQKCLSLQLKLTMGVFGTSMENGFDYILSRLEAKLAVLDCEEEFWSMFCCPSGGSGGGSSSSTADKRGRLGKKMSLEALKTKIPLLSGSNSRTRKGSGKVRFTEQVCYNGFVFRPEVFPIKHENGITAYGLRLVQETMVTASAPPGSKESSGSSLRSMGFRNPL